MGKFNREQYKSGQHALTAKQAKELLLTFSNIQDKAMIALAMSVGLRREDLVNVKRKDFNPKEGTITYFEHKKKRTRTVYIPSQETIQLLIMHIQACRKSEWLFPSPKVTGKFKNSHISSRQVYDILNEHLDNAGMGTRPFHALRATCYKICKEAGWTPRMAAELLGDSITVAEVHYGAPSVGEMQEAAKKMPIL
jgi:integrase